MKDDFGKFMLEKYGWSQYSLILVRLCDILYYGRGKGLGKEETGISKAICPSVQNDNKGVKDHHCGVF